MMKSTINLKHELANRLVKYFVSFDGNKENNARERGAWKYYSSHSSSSNFKRWNTFAL